MKPSLEKILALLQRQPRWRLVAGGAGLVLLLFVAFRGSHKNGNGEAATFVARRGPLDITVLEGGSLQALESQEIKCEIRSAPTKIIRIVEEGYLVTPDDIATNKVLVELDSGDLQKQIVQQDISYESSKATLIDAQEAYAIQLGQNLSDIKAAEQKARFARLDFDKYLGSNVTQTVIEKLNIEKELAATQTNINELTSAVLATDDDAPKSGNNTNGTTVASVPLSPSPMASPLVPRASVNFTPYAKLELLGDGEAKQKLRKFADDLQVAQLEFAQATSNLEGAKRLFEKGYVTKVDLERDELAYENSRLKVQTAETARDLFIRYDFNRSAEDFLSKYAEAVREVVRARRAAVSKQAQAQAKLKSAQGLFNIQSRNRKDLYEQLDKCTLTAKRPGLVIYGAGRDDHLSYGQEPVREGATMRDRQTIITIPDMTKMSVRVKIHESYIKKIEKGQKARITVDAYPDKVLDGEVNKVAVLPDSGNRYLNPDLKIYPTSITIAETHDWLKPGMTAKVEIFVARLTDVVYVPIQAVSPWEDQQVCYIANGSRKPQRRVVDIGECNDEFIEIRHGLKEGERVLLRPLVKTADEATEPEDKPKATSPKKG
jgi:multidrug resistance efflux pump